MKNKIFYLFFALLFIQCNNDVEEKTTINIYKWETSKLMHTTYFYEIKNNTEKDAIIKYVVEATCEDGTVYSNEDMVEVSAGKTRKSSTFFSTQGKSVTKMDVVDIKSMANPLNAFFD